MRPLLAHLVSVSALLFTPLLALSPLPPGTPQPPPPTLEQVWDKTDAIVYGRAVRVQVTLVGPDSAPAYDSTLSIERCWKGNLSGDVLIEGSGPIHSSLHESFHIGQTYIVRLRKLPKSDAYTPAEIHEFQLGPDGEPLPLRSPAALRNPFALFGDPQPEPDRYNESALVLFEFAERMAGHEESAKRAYALRTGPKLERERLAREKAAADFLVSARTDLQRALDTELLADRKTLLLALQELLKERHGGGLDEIKQRITGELSVTETLLSNGIKVRRKIAP